MIFGTHTSDDFPNFLIVADAHLPVNPASAPETNLENPYIPKVAVAHTIGHVAVGYGIKKLQIMMTIVDDLVSVDSLVEDYLTAEPANEYIQSCDIVAFNKI